VRLVDLLEDAGIARGAVDVVFSGADHGLDRGTEDDYRRALGVADASSEEILVAYAMNGQPLPRSTASRRGSSSPAGTAWRT
jgi:DMSO/TMAO reductase YedYZ molybdopterin-dependent catalytic subunit